MPNGKDTAEFPPARAVDSIGAGPRIDTADSLTAGFAAADSLATDSLAAGDSLRMPVVGTDDAGKEIRDARAVYGPGSRVVRTVQDTPVRIPVNPVSGNIGLQIVILAAAAAWCLMAYRFRDQIKTCVKGFFSFKNEDKFSADQSYLYDKLVGYAIPLCAVGIGIFITKTVAAVWPEIISTLPSWAIVPIPLAVSAVLLLIFALQSAVIRMAGALTLSQMFAATIILNKKIYLTVTVILTLPIIALYSGLDSTIDAVIAYIVVGVVVAVSMIFVLKTMILFIRQNVSLLVWILYLCAIEIFPVSLITLLVIKNI